MKRKHIVLFAVGCLLSLSASGQRVRNNHLFFHVDFAAGNIYTAAFSSFATWGLNEATHSNIFENALEIPVYSGERGGQDMKVKNYDVVGFSARDLFNTLHPSLKLGYLTSNMGEINFGFYASAEYCANQFKNQFPAASAFESNRLQRALMGGSAFIVLGGLGQKYHFMIEAGARYSLALAYNGPLGSDKEAINNGLTSHYALKLTGAAALQDFGIYADFHHFDLLKSATDKLHAWNVGLLWTVTPGQGKTRQDSYRYRTK